MAIKKIDWAKWRERLKTVYRFQIVDEKHYDVKLVFGLKPSNILILTGLILAFFTLLNFFLIAYTPLKQYIPGYGTASGRRDIIKLNVKTEELEEKVIANKKYILNLQNILNDKVVIDAVKTKLIEEKADTGLLNVQSTNEIEFISKIEKGLQNATLIEAIQKSTSSPLSNLKLVKPVSGNIIHSFSSETQAISYKTAPDEPIKAIAAGTIIDLKNGSSITIQADNHIVYILKNTGEVLQKIGTFVEPNQIIAKAGNEKTITLQVWFKGKPINPTKYLK